MMNEQIIQERSQSVVATLQNRGGVESFSEWWRWYGDFTLDILIYIGGACILLLLTKWFWESRQIRRLEKEAAEQRAIREEE